jgi:enoyl-CoA hydratase/carnithine racemase
MPESPVIIARNLGEIFEITFNRPEKLNALTPQVYRELDRVIETFEHSIARVCILRGAGDKAFIAGADIQHYVGITKKDYSDFMNFGHEVTKRIRSIPKPFISAINGYALGGGLEIALNCDLIVASDSSKLGLPEALLGLLPGGGGTQLLPRLIGRVRANDLIMRGRFLTALEAFQYGLVSQVISADKFEDELDVYVKQVLKHAPKAQGMLKGLVYDGLDLPLDEAIKLETLRTAELIESDEGIEGITAFVEKRKPNFSKN